MSIVIIGLGYVGLPLALAFSEHYKVIGYDNDVSRIEELNNFKDRTGQVEEILLQKLLYNNSLSSGLKLTDKLKTVTDPTIYIVTVPTPINEDKSPDLNPLFDATKHVGKYLKKGDIVVFESTVYPGCTEDDCVPVLEQYSGLLYNTDFSCGYSPERINVGDKVNTLKSIVKITSGSNEATATIVDNLYASVITAGTYKASSIKVAEAAKAIENAQRDLNISFVNELALIFDKMGIDTTDVIEAASSKWNFLPFKPGLVGGHCIGVDPYYLTHKAKALGYSPEVIMSGRKVNENMGAFVGKKVLSLLNNSKKLSILLLGITFKENCSDIRNSGVLPLYNYLISQDVHVVVYDPWAEPIQVYKEYSVHLLPQIDEEIHYDAVILAVAHEQFKLLNYEKWRSKSTVIYDVKSFLERKYVDSRL